MDFFSIVYDFFRILPLISGAYISIIILRFPDLTIEGSWSIAGIISCIMIQSINPDLALLFGVLTGAICGLLTGIIFVIIGRAKFLSGLISLFFLLAIGYNLLGERASIILEPEFSKFGFAAYSTSKFISNTYYYLISGGAYLIVVIWQVSSLGIKARLLGENPKASLYYNFSINKNFIFGLVISNALVGLGGALYSLHEGMADNSQGIGHILIAFFALLIGDELMRLLKVSRRSVPGIIIVGSAIYAFLSNITFLIITILQKSLSPEAREYLNINDDMILLGSILLIVLWIRRKEKMKKSFVSEW